MTLYTAAYTLRNGHRAELQVIAADSCSAVLQLLDHFGCRLRCVSVRPA
ncbi:MAG: hypothetical protein V4792_16425 [Pseudomonadota bacterium]